MKNIFKPSSIEAGILISRRHIENPELSLKHLIDASKQIRESDYDYDSISEFFDMHDINMSFFSFEEEDFFSEDISKNVLYKLIKLIKPSWMEEAFLGINHIKEKINLEAYGPDILQCFKNAGLLSELKGTTASWWLKIMQDSRPDDSNLLELGTKGEDLTIEYEERYLKENKIDEQVQNIALLFPDEKYDVKSWRKNYETDEIYPIQIESKKTTLNHFFLSRGEYETGKSFGETYFIYYWDNENQTKPKIMNLASLQKHIPKDNTRGTWINVEIKPIADDFI